MKSLVYQLKSIRYINYKLLVFIIASLLIPSIYTTFRIYLISDIPNEWGFNIASQIAWLNIIYEILQEGITFPLFFILGALVNRPDYFYQKIQNGLRLILPIYALLALVIWVFSDYLVVHLSQQPNLIDETVTYIRWEAIAIPFRVLVDIVLIALITLSATHRLLIYLALQLVIRTCCDFIFMSPDMLDMGIMGAAYASVTINAILAIAGFIILNQLCVHSKLPNDAQGVPVSFDIHWKKWLKISGLSGVESAVRNIAFIVMILKLINEVNQAGTYWITNNFIWGWLLLPILALGQLVKQDVGTSPNKSIGNRFKIYFILTAILIIFWLITIPLWDVFIHNIMNIKNSADIVSLTLYLLVFYVIFAINNLFDSYLYGRGRTDLMLYQSLFVNCVYYGIMFFLYRAGVFVPNLHSIALLFGFGITLDFIVTIVLFKKAGYPLKEPL